MAAEALPSWRVSQGPSLQLCFSNIHMNHLICKERAVDVTSYCSAFNIRIYVHQHLVSSFLSSDTQIRSLLRAPQHMDPQGCPVARSKFRAAQA